MWFNKQTLLRSFKNLKYKWKEWYLISHDIYLFVEIQAEQKIIHLGENFF